MAVAYLNGEWLAPEDARVPVFDRGFMFGDGIYEFMAVYSGQVFLLGEHLDRLHRSMSEVSIDSPHTREQWQQLLTEAVEKSGEQTACLYLQVTRGVAMPRAHEFPEQPEPTVLITVMDAPQLQRSQLQRKAVTPLRITTREDYRWGRGDIKVISLIGNVLLKNEARAAGYDDAALIRNGKVTEATAANLFIVKEGAIITPPKSNFLLHGITRDHIIKLARDADIPVEERDVGEAELASADEVWLSSTGLEICPVSEVNDITVGNGEAGVVFATLDKLFQASKPA